MSGRPILFQLCRDIGGCASPFCKSSFYIIANEEEQKKHKESASHVKGKFGKERNELSSQCDSSTCTRSMITILTGYNPVFL